MNRPHKHAELIKAWADGAEIEWVGATYNDGRKHWTDCKSPVWDEESEYRIKPEPEPEPQKVTMYIYNNMKDGRTWMDVYPNEMLYPEWQYMGKIEVLK